MRRPNLVTAWQDALLAAACGLLCASVGTASLADGTATTVLRERFAALSSQAQPNPFGLPIHLQSRETSDHLEGEVFARIDHPFATVHQALGRGDRWCDILILHPNVKYCRATRTMPGEVLHVGIGRKYHQPLVDVHWVRFDFQASSAGPDALQVVLKAPTGPLSTRDYRLMVEAAPLSPGATVLHMTYGYSFGTVGRWAMQSYLATLGRDKVGFSVTGRRADGQPIFIDGMRAVVERNAMRYFLAIGAHVGASPADGRRQMHRSLVQWFDATERFALQLHEVERSEYLDMKVREIRRQETVVFPPGAG